MKNRALLLAGFFLLIVVGLATLHRQKQISIEVQNHIQNEPTKSTKQEKSSSKGSIKNKTELEFEQSLTREAIKVGQIDQDPSHTQRELERWAQVLSINQMKILREKAIDTEVSGDERSLSVYLLSLSADSNALPLLNEIASTPLPRTQNDRILTFEETIRAQAIEGIINNPNHELAKNNLKEIVGKIDSSYLTERSQRGIAYLEGKTESSLQYETKMMQKLIKKTR